MDAQEILSLLDSLDLNEDIINVHLNKIMLRKSHKTNDLINALRFLKYKLEVNRQESIDCKNEKEIEFAARLIQSVTPEDLQLVCDITNIALQLDPNTIVSKSEHLLQQILNGIELPLKQMVVVLENDSTTRDTPPQLITLKLCSSILRAVISTGEMLSLRFFDVPLENMVFSEHEETLKFFFVNTVPEFTKAIKGYSILDRIWNCLVYEKGFRETALKALGALSDYYLPVGHDAETRHTQYSIVTRIEFWETMLFGLQSKNTSTRKTAIYLIKRALESLSGSQKDININTEEMVMVWDQKNEEILKTMWDNFFVLLDSLDEVQSNIVLPSLGLFESVRHLGHCWLSCAYNIGLKHENATVRLNCIKYRLEIKMENIIEATAVLNALNDINLYENAADSRQLTTAVANTLDDKQSYMKVLEAIPSVKWSPVPLFYLTETIGEVVYPSLLMQAGHQKVCSIINDILRIPINSPIIKKAIYGNIANFIINSCKGFNWEDYLSIYPLFHSETPITSYLMSPLSSHIKKNLYLTDADKKFFGDIMSTTYENINIGLLYVSGHDQDGILFFLNAINDKVANILDMCNRPYANKAQCFSDVIFLINVYSKTVGRAEPYMVTINAAVLQQFKVIFQFILCLLSTSTTLEVENILTLFEALKCMQIAEPIGDDDIFSQLYTICCRLLQHSETPLHKKTFAMSLMGYLHQNCVLIKHITQHNGEMLSLDQFLTITNCIGNDMNVKGSGKLKNMFYERSCEILLAYLANEVNYNDLLKVFMFADDILDRGGYGCLKYVLKTIGTILPKLIDNKDINFDLSKFLKKTWDQICEIKTNREYVICVNEFVKLITQDLLLQHPIHNGVVVDHYKNIVHVAVTKRMPLYCLVKHLSTKSVLQYDNLVDVICEILLYAVVPKKDHRIAENLTVQLSPKMQGIVLPDTHVCSQHIQFLSIAMLNKVTDVGTLNDICEKLMAETDALLRNNNRYYPNSTTHRKLFRALQNILYIFLKNRQINVKKIAFWCMALFKFQHDTSVKVCLLWFIALYIYSNDIPLNFSAMNILSSNGVPLQYQLTILYYVIRHKITVRTHYASETEFALDYFLSHTMGPNFHLRLTAQYYALLLLEMSGVKKKINNEKYSTVLVTLGKTLGDLATSKDKAFDSLRTDYFTQTFDIVGDLTVMFIFHSMQRRCETLTSNENIDTAFALRIFGEIEDFVPTESHDTFYVEWKSIHRWHTFQHYPGLPTSGMAEGHDEAVTIQKKYIPWRNMTELEANKFRQNPMNASDLIVVASLVDRTTNLGGLARTCEVFGVSTYVISNLAHTRDKQFQALSVSSERWLNIDEVQPAKLKEYLMTKKCDGYCVVAAEQTSNSVSLMEFKWPKKALIMLGHEKDGIPPNLLPLMDYCVEIPQKGVIRSLNVHVTASIFIFEYVKQIAT